MCKKSSWTRIDPLLHRLQYLTDQDIIYYHIEYISKGGYQINQWVSNYKKGVEHRNDNQWHYKKEAIQNFANLIIRTHFLDKCVLLAAPPSKRPESPLFDSRNQDVLELVHRATGIPARQMSTIAENAFIETWKYEDENSKSPNQSLGLG